MIRSFTKNRGQVSIEFMSYIAMAIFITIIFLVIIIDVIEDKTTDKDDLKVKIFGRTLQREIELASSVKTGYTRQLEIPDEINNLDYNISCGPNYFFINYKGRSIYFNIPEINGSLHKGDNLIVNRYGRIHVI